MVGTLPSTFLSLRKAVPYFEKKNRKNAMHRPTMERYTALGLCMVRLTSCSLPYYTLLFASSRGNAKFVEFFSKATESTEGPAFFSLEDPDGNQILVDQHR
jgi:hypothetical protein